MTDPGCDPYEAYTTDPPVRDEERPVDFDDDEERR